MIDPLERWRELGLPDKPDYAGLLTFGGMPLHPGPRRAERGRRGDRRGADGRSRLRPARARGSARARSARRAVRPVRTSRPGSTPSPSCGSSTTGTRPSSRRIPLRSLDAIEAPRRPGRSMRALCRCPRRRPLDRRARYPCGGRAARAGRARPLRHAHGHRDGGLRRRAVARDADVPTRRATATSTRTGTCRSGCGATGPGEGEFAWQAEHGITSLFMHDVRDRGIAEIAAGRSRSPVAAPCSSRSTSTCSTRRSHPERERPSLAA